MPVTVQQQTNFTSGEIDPLLRARTDIKHYVNGAEKLRNVIPLPQGGVRRRPGFEYQATISPDDTADDILIFEFVFSFAQSFVMVIRTDGASTTAIDIFEDGALVDTLTNGADAIPWGHADIRDLKWTQFLDTLLVFHPDHAPFQIKRLSSVWSAAAVSFLNTPTFDFNDAGGDIVAGVNMVIQIHFFDAGRNDRKYSLLLDGIETEDIVYSTTLSILATRIQTVLRDLDITSATGITVAHNASESIGMQAFDVTFTGDDGSQEWDLQPGYIHIGTDDLVDTVITTQGKEPGAPVWSATRGWPVSGAFFQNRLCIAGASSRPDTFWASRTNDPFNFDTSRDLVDYAIDITSSSAVVSTFRDITSGRHLLIHSEKSQWYIPVSETEPMTPQNVSLIKSSNRGTSTRVRPQESDGEVVFLDQNDNEIFGMTFTDLTQAYRPQSLSILSAHLLNTPIDSALRKSTDNNDADYMFWTNTDGSLAVYCTLKDQEVNAWVLWTTTGDVLGTAVAKDEVFLLVRRSIDSVDTIFLEKLSDDLTLDAAEGLFTGVSGVTVSSDISHLQGETVSIVVDNQVETAQALVSPATTVTFENTAESYWQAGLEFPIVNGLDANVWAKTLPPEFGDQRGATTMRRKRIPEVNANFFETNEAYINGNLVSFQDMNENILDQGIDKFTGNKTIGSLLGWSETPFVEVTQKDPLYMTLLGLSYKVSG